MKDFDERLIYDEPRHDRWTLRLAAIVTAAAALGAGFGVVWLLGWW